MPKKKVVKKIQERTLDSLGQKHYYIFVTPYTEGIFIDKELLDKCVANFNDKFSPATLSIRKTYTKAGKKNIIKVSLNVVSNDSTAFMVDALLKRVGKLEWTLNEPED
jgi:hypothetical protein